MLPLTRILVFVERRAVKAAQAVVVAGEVGRHPVDDHTDTRPVQAVDQRHQRLWRTKPAGGGKHPDGLVAPAGRERVFCRWKKLDMGELLLDQIGDQFPFQIDVAEPAAGIVSGPAPAAEVDLVNVHRGGERIALGAARQPLAVVPLVVPQIDHAGGGARRQFGGEAVGIGPVDGPPGGVHPEFVERPDDDPRDEQLPDPCRTPVHLVDAAVPVVEIPDHTHALGVGGPDREIDPRHPIEPMEVRAELLVAAPVAAFVKQVDVEFCQHAWERIGVVQIMLSGCRVVHPQHVGRLSFPGGGIGCGEQPLVNSRPMHAAHRL